MELLLIISLAVRLYGAHIAHEDNMFESTGLKYFKIAAALLLEIVAIYYIIKRHLLT